MSINAHQVRDYFHLGKALKSHGTGGQLRLLVEDRFKSYLSPEAFVFFDLDGSKVPFRITDAEDAQHFVVTLDDVKSKDASDLLSGKEIYIPLHLVKSRHQRSPRNLKEQWADYSIINQADQQSYAILRTEEYPQQLMAVIASGDREVLIPLHDQLILEIDHDQKHILMDFPEGLLSL